jgi:hypothetical protein
MFNGNNLNNIWQQTRSGLNENPDFLEGLQDFESELGLSIDEDIFGWMTGEFTLAIVKTATAEAFLPPFGAYALIGTDNIEQATSSLEKVTGVLSEQGMLPPLETTTVDGIEVNGLVDTITGEVQGGYGFYNNYFFVAYAEDSLKSLVAAPQNSLNSSENFSAVRNHLPGSNYGYFYADIDQAQSLIEEQLSDFEREEYEKNGRPFIDPLRAMGFATNTGGLEQGVSKGAFFFLMTE